ncbi:hypothetical protein MESS2_1000078 [Mesorhizobium metallidurans STM 2683]|uniref:Uncharacterized protein n=1 Tax=Mesorhizobium metallidurans STM 2683 TaxID=1297569 RepID=M5EEI3_9HYPH|nr:hypothetical protein MESS2_1000078 [Mesorhizobium metallidurans STM 2683]
MARPSHQADPAVRRQFEALAGYGIPELGIARLIGVNPKTLRKATAPSRISVTSRQTRPVAGGDGTRHLSCQPPFLLGSDLAHRGCCLSLDRQRYRRRDLQNHPAGECGT